MTNPNEKKAADDFLPMSKKAMKRRGWSQCDFVFVIGDAYVDHSSFGPAIISRHLEANGYKVGIISQPDWKDDASQCWKHGFHGQSLYGGEKETKNGCVYAGRRDGETPGLCNRCVLEFDSQNV